MATAPVSASSPPTVRWIGSRGGLRTVAGSPTSPIEVVSSTSGRFDPTVATTARSRSGEEAWWPGPRTDRVLAGSVDYRDTGIVIYSMEQRTYETLTDFGQWPVFLPDSGRILFVSGGDRFFIVDVDTRAVREIYSATQHVLGPPRLSEDGHEMFFTRRVTEGDIWLLRLPAVPVP